MSKHKNTDKICVCIVAVSLVIALLFCNGKVLGIESAERVIGYENRLFDNTRVHTVDIVMDDWDSFIETCESEEYSACTVIIDGEKVSNVGIRGKGNTSLSSVKSSGSSRYSFKLEFDQYDSTKSYHGLDKLCLNNIIQDNTYMKDYLAYTLMSDFGVDSPLCSYAYITVNGEDWGLYLAVEAIEDSFLERNYGTNYGDLYKPDSLSFGGGGPGNARDFSMTDFMNKNTSNNEDNEDTGSSKRSAGGFGGMMGGFGMGSDDVKLKYIDNDPDSYSNIFNNAKTTVTEADKKRLISSLKSLYEQTDIEDVVDVEEVIRYFVVHNFLCNGDSYTGSMIHNYYLYEKDGQLSMIPWDYNLAYGSFTGGNASSSVNSAIDTPISGDMSDRPMIAWIFGDEEYTEMYHEYFSEFLDSVDFAEMIETTAALIDEYVEKDPTKFCTYEDFQKGVEAIKQFCVLREESVLGQLDGTIPSTTAGQNADSSSLIDVNGLSTSDMGSMGGGNAGGNGGGFGGFGGFGGKTTDRGSRSSSASSSGKSNSDSSSETEKPSADSFPSGGFGGDIPGDFDPSQFGGSMPEGFDPSQFGGSMPDDFENSDTSKSGRSKPNNFDASQFSGNMPDGFDISGGSGVQSSSELILLIVSFVFLAGGILFAALYKRRKSVY